MVEFPCILVVQKFVFMCYPQLVFTWTEIAVLDKFSFVRRCPLESSENDRFSNNTGMVSATQSEADILPAFLGKPRARAECISFLIKLTRPYYLELK